MRVALLLCLVSLPALAQVTTNNQALDALKPAPAPKAATAPLHKPVPLRRPVIKRVARPSPPIKAPPQVPLAPPANPVIAPPVFVMPAHPRTPPPPVPIRADAPGTTTAIQDGSRITFGPGVASLNQATHDAIMAFVPKARANPALTISVTAWAPGTADDPSPPRTLALERALAARAVLINAGVPSERILAVSRGIEGIGAGPADRLDITAAAAPRATPVGKPGLAAQSPDAHAALKK